MQRMVWFLLCLTVLVACIWLAGTHILKRTIPADEADIAYLADRYLKIAVLGLPGYACWESGKRYVQAQGQFQATMHVLIIVGPSNVLLQWLFVWHFDWGFVGCPIGLVISQTFLPILLAAYTWLFIGSDCWELGLTKRAFVNWGPMIKLALPGMVMVMAEYLAFEIPTVASAQISATHLGAQTILMNLVVIAYMFPFPLSIASSTRLANLIGASRPESGKVTARLTYIWGACLGIFSMVILSSLCAYIPRAFSSDEVIIALAAAVLPVNAAFQLVDALTAQCNGILRGLGRQHFGSYVSILAFYVIAIPLSLGTTFGLGYSLCGL